MKKIFAMAVLLVACVGLGAKQLAVLPDLMKPERLVVRENYIYVGEFPQVYIFSAKDFSLVKKFGKAGEGPKEFNTFLILRATKDRLVVNSMGKVTFYTLKGEYIEEKRVNARSGLNMLPLGKDRFVGRGVMVEEEQQYITVNLYDGEMKKLKELGRMPTGLQGGKIKILDQQAAYETDGERIYVMIGKAFVINVYDREGTKVHSIDHDYKRVPFTDKDKERILEEVRTDPRRKRFFDFIKDNAVYPSHWPSVASVFPEGDKLYVLTFKREKDSYEFFTFSKKGSMLKHQMLPIRFRTAMQPYPTDIRGGKLYQILENDDEEWELHAWPL